MFSLQNLEKEDDVRKYVIARTTTTKSGKTQTKRPKIQRLVTPLTVQRKRHMCVYCCRALALAGRLRGSVGDRDRDVLARETLVQR